MNNFGKGDMSPSQKISATRNLPSLISGFLEYTKAAPAPFIFKKWAAISMVASCLTRRVWAVTEQGIIYPNSMILLVGAASVGKGPAIDPVERFLQRVDTTNDVLRQFEGIHLGPGDTTVAGLFDEFMDERSQKTLEIDEEKLSFSSVIMIAEELSAFMHHVDMQMMGYLIRFLNCARHSQRLRGKGETQTIERPVLHILGGVQPKMLSQIFPAAAFGMGLTARTTFVYSNEKVKVSPFKKQHIDIHLGDKIVHDLTKVSRLSGQFIISEEAENHIEDWWMTAADSDRQTHPKLEGYNGKRILHLIRLCMVHAAARHEDLIIELQDAKLALADMLEVEKVMPNIFDEMTGEAGAEDVFGDISHQLRGEYAKTNEPIPYYILSRMIAKKVKPYEVLGVIEGLLNQELIKQTKGTKNLPGGGRKAFIPGDISE